MVLLNTRRQITRELVKERVTGVPPAEDLEGHERVCAYHDIGAGWYEQQSLKIVRSSFKGGASAPVPSS